MGTSIPVGEMARVLSSHVVLYYNPLHSISVDPHDLVGGMTDYSLYPIDGQIEARRDQETCVRSSNK